MKKIHKAAIIVSVFLVAFGLFTLFCKPGHEPGCSEPQPYTLPAQTDRTWDTILASPASITVIPIKTGTFYSSDNYVVLDRNDPNISHIEPQGTVDILAFLVRHEKQGDILIDTGFDSSFYKNPPYGNYGPSLIAMFSTTGNTNQQAAGEDIASQLSEFKASPPRVFFTHLHPDHTAGMPELPDDIEYIFGTKEMIPSAMDLVENHFEGKTKLRTLDFSNAKDMPPFGPSLDIFGDGSVWAISTPGHSPDHISYLVNAESGPVLISGDVVFGYAQLEYGIRHGGFVYDALLADESLAMIRAFIQKYPQTKVYTGHELPRE